MKQMLFCAIQFLLLVCSALFIISAINKKIAWITNDEKIFISFVVYGVAVCAIGILFRVVGPYKYTMTNQWFSALTIINGALGVLAIVVIYLGFAKKQLMYVKDYASASKVLAGIILLKTLCSFVKAILKK